MEKLTPEQIEVRQIFKLSFMHSQGSSSFQPHIFDYMRYFGFLKPMDIDEIPLFLLDIKPPTNHVVQVDASQVDALRFTFIGFKRYLGENPKLMTNYFKPDNHAHYLSAGLSNFDKRYQNDKRGVPPFTENISIDLYDSYFDPHASFLRRYAVLGHPTGHPGYDQMYKHIAEFISDDLGYLDDLVKVWEPNHPGGVFFPENWIHTRGTHAFLKPKPSGIKVEPEDSVGKFWYNFRTLRWPNG